MRPLKSKYLLDFGYFKKLKNQNEKQMDFSHYVFGRVGEQDTVHVISIQVAVLISWIFLKL